MSVLVAGGYFWSEARLPCRKVKEERRHSSLSPTTEERCRGCRGIVDAMPWMPCRGEHALSRKPLSACHRSCSSHPTTVWSGETWGGKSLGDISFSRRTMNPDVQTCAERPPESRMRRVWLACRSQDLLNEGGNLFQLRCAVSTRGDPRLHGMGKDAARAWACLGMGSRRRVKLFGMQMCPRQQKQTGTFRPMNKTLPLHPIQADIDPATACSCSTALLRSRLMQSCRLCGGQVEGGSREE